MSTLFISHPLFSPPSISSFFPLLPQFLITPCPLISRQDGRKGGGKQARVEEEIVGRRVTAAYRQLDGGFFPCLFKISLSNSLALSLCLSLFFSLSHTCTHCRGLCSFLSSCVSLRVLSLTNTHVSLVSVSDNGFACICARARTRTHTYN